MNGIVKFEEQPFEYRDKDRVVFPRVARDKWSMKYEFYAGESTDQPSLTRPDMELNISQAVARMRIGQKIETYVPQYTDELDIEVPEFEKMDRLEKLQWAAKNRDEIARLREEYNKQFEPPTPAADPEPDPASNPAPNPAPPADGDS